MRHAGIACLRRAAVPAVLLAAPLGAQAVVPPPPLAVPVRVRVENVAINAALGATVTALHAWIADRAARRALAWGAAGGAITSVGRQVVGTRGALAGWGGRLVHEAGLGIGRFGVTDTLELPLHVGPVVARWRPATGAAPSVRLDLTALVFTAAFASASSAKIDWRASAWSGGTVLRLSSADLGAAADQEVWGGTLPGVIALTDELYGTAPADRRRLVLAHETIHLLQFDAQHDWIGRPSESRLFRGARWRRGLARVIELGAIGPLGTGLALGSLRYDRQPAEREAWWLTSGRPAPAPRR